MTKICGSLESSRGEVFAKVKVSGEGFPCAASLSIAEPRWLNLQTFLYITPIIFFNQVVYSCRLELAPTHFPNCVKPCILFSDNLSFSKPLKMNTFFPSTVKNQIMSPNFKEKICHGKQTKNTICMQRELKYWKSTLASREWYH